MSLMESTISMLKISREEANNVIIKRLLCHHVLALFRDREKVAARRSFIAVIRQGGLRVARPRKLKCCDIVIFETSLGPNDHVSEQIVEKCIDEYIKWELKFY